MCRAPISLCAGEMKNRPPVVSLRQDGSKQQALAVYGECALRSQDLDDILAEACHLVGEAVETGHAKILEIRHAYQQRLVKADVGWDLCECI